MNTTMRAVVFSEPGGVDKLVVKDVPISEIKPGFVRIRVKAFGVNESEVTSRRYPAAPARGVLPSRFSLSKPRRPPG